MATFGAVVQNTYSNESLSSDTFLKIVENDADCKEDQNLTPAGSLQDDKVESISAVPHNLVEGQLDINLRPVLPDDLIADILTRHALSTPIGSSVDPPVLRKKMGSLMKNPLFLDALNEHEQTWLVNGIRETAPGVLTIFLYSVFLKKDLHISLKCPLDYLKEQPAFTLSCRAGDESGAIYIVISDCCSCSCSTPVETGRDIVVINPITHSLRQTRLPLGCSCSCGKSICRSSHTYLVQRVSVGLMAWASNESGGLCPLIHDASSDTWKPMGSGFATSALIRPEIASADGVVYMRYQERQHKDLLLTYRDAQNLFAEVQTTGLPEILDLDFQHLFQYRGIIFLVAAIQRTKRGTVQISNVFLYKLKNNRWWKISTMPKEQLELITGKYPMLSKLQFLVVDHKLVVAGRKTERVRSGSYVKPSQKACVTDIVSYDFHTEVWGTDNVDRLGCMFNPCTTVLVPRLDL